MIVSFYFCVFVGFLFFYEIFAADQFLRINHKENTETYQNNLFESTVESGTSVRGWIYLNQYLSLGLNSNNDQIVTVFGIATNKCIINYLISDKQTFDYAAIYSPDEGNEH